VGMDGLAAMGRSGSVTPPYAPFRSRGRVEI
jgi:hypothetical protein